MAEEFLTVESFKSALERGMFRCEARTVLEDKKYDPFT